MYFNRVTAKAGPCLDISGPSLGLDHFQGLDHILGLGHFPGLNSALESDPAMESVLGPEARTGPGFLQLSILGILINM